MKIAVVGGGTQCKRLMRVVEQHQFVEIHPEIIAVADIVENAPGYLLAKERGLEVTRDYNDFFKRDDIELIIELTGDMDIYNDILNKKSRNVRAISAKTAHLFWELSRVSTLQKKFSQELTETRARYDAIMNDLIQEEVMVIGYDYRILDVNEKVLSSLGLTREEVIGHHCHEITHHLSEPCRGENHPCPLIQTMASKKPTQTTHVHKGKDGKEIYYSLSTYPLTEEGEVIGAIEVGRDISKDIRLQKTMMNQEKLASVGRLSAGVAHEINNPLTTILTTAMLIQEDLDEGDPLNEELATIANEALRCRKIVTSLLNFARQNKPAKRRYNLNNIIRDSIGLTRKQAAFRDISITEDLYDGMPTFLVDSDQIQQVLINLIQNAVEATEPGGEIVVSSGCSKDNQLGEISVTDSGSGIPKERIESIFDPFFTTKEHGTGLGLAIVHGIVENHGGMVNVESKEGEGTTFTIRLPWDGNR